MPHCFKSTSHIFQENGIFCVIVLTGKQTNSTENKVRSESGHKLFNFINEV